MDYTLIVSFTDERAWLQAASLISGENYVKREAGKDGNTLDIIVGRAAADIIGRQFGKRFPRDPNIPLPGQIGLPLLDPDPGDARNE